MMHYRIGQTYPLEGESVLGSTLTDNDGRPRPAWFIFTTPPMKERAAEAWMMKQGALEAWHPTITDWVPARGANPRRKKIPVVRRVAPGYVFAFFDLEPRWHLWFEASCGRISRVVTHDMMPLAIPDEVIATMKMVPRRVQALHAKAEDDRLAEILAKQVRPGDAAKITEGPLAGVEVKVESIHSGLAQCLAWGFRKIAIDTATLERKA